MNVGPGAEFRCSVATSPRKRGFHTQINDERRHINRFFFLIAKRGFILRIKVTKELEKILTK